MGQFNIDHDQTMECKIFLIVLLLRTAFQNPFINNNNTVTEDNGGNINDTSKTNDEFEATTKIPEVIVETESMTLHEDDLDNSTDTARLTEAQSSSNQTSTTDLSLEQLATDTTLSTSISSEELLTTTEDTTKTTTTTLISAEAPESTITVEDVTYNITAATAIGSTMSDTNESSTASTEQSLSTIIEATKSDPLISMEQPRTAMKIDSDLTANSEEPTVTTSAEELISTSTSEQSTALPENTSTTTTTKPESSTTTTTTTTSSKELLKYNPISMTFHKTVNKIKKQARSFHDILHSIFHH